MAHAAAGARPEPRATLRFGRGSFLLGAATFVAVAVAPLFLVFFDLSGHDAQRIVQLALLAIAAVVVAAGCGVRQGGVGLHGRRFLVIVAALATLAALSVANAALPRAALLEAALAVALAIFAVGIARTASDFGTARMLAIPVAASLLFAAMVAVRYGAALVTGAALLREHLLPAYSNYRFFNHVQTVTIPLLLAASMAEPSNCGLRRWAVVALIAEFCLLFFTGGRATMLGLALAAFAAGVALRGAAAPWLLRFAATAAAGAAAYALLFVAVPMALGLSRDFFAADTVTRSELGVGGPREYLWGLAWQYVRESPWLGIGPMHYAHRINVEAAHPHNVYLQLAAEWGIPFAAIVLALAVSGWLRLVRAAHAGTGDADRALGISLAAIGVAVAVDGTFSGNFVMPMSQLWIAFAVGLAIAYVRAANGAHALPAARPAQGARWAIVALCAGSQVATAQGIWPEIRDVNAHVDRVRAEIVHNVVDNPRIWSHGWMR
jgi:O-antigen ligase